MKRTTIARRLKKVNVNKNSFAYRVVAEIAGISVTTFAVYKDVIRPCHTSGTGRFTTNLDYTSQVRTLLDTLKVKYEFGNDAPRGALSGNYIKIINIK